MFEHLAFAVRSGALVPALLMLPNVFWLLWSRESAGTATAAPLPLVITENASRVVVLMLPFFLSLHMNNRFSVPVMVGMGISLTVYYAGWIRYFTSGADARLLYAPICGIPLPMAVMPSLFLLLSAYLMNSYLMMIASLIFGMSHIWISALTH